jgi:hypothetical protein
MKNVLIFGDSHVENVSVAFNEVETSLNISFFSASGPIGAYLKISDNELSLLPAPKVYPANPTISNEQFHILYDKAKSRLRSISTRKTASLVLNDYDAIVMYGGQFFPKDYRWWDIVRMKKKYSLGLLSSMVKESLHAHNRMGYLWVHCLADYVSKGGNMFVVLPPLLNEKGLVGKHDSAQPLSIFQETPLDVNFREMLPIYSHLVKGMEGNLIEAPEDLFSEDGRGTSGEFKSFNPLDFYHLNPNGAKLIINNIIDAIVLG